MDLSTLRSPLDALPNLLTCARVALVPVVAALVLTAPDEWQLAAAIFAAAAVSDALDGHIARARGCITTFGTLMDPVADKLLIGAALVALAAVDRASAWLAVAVIARELAVSALRWHAKRGGLVISASPLGKAKMAFQVATVLALMAVGDGAGWVQALAYATVAITIVSGVDYYLTYRRRRPRLPAAVAADQPAVRGR